MNIQLKILNLKKKLMSKKQSILIQTVLAGWLDRRYVILEPKCCFRQEMQELKQRWLTLTGWT